jgi:hypothetical protein
MSSVCVPTLVIERGQLPPVCPRHGFPSTDMTSRTFYTRPPTWVFALCLVSLAVPVLVALALRRSVQGRVPTCESCAGARVIFVQRSIALWAASLITLAAAVLLGNGVLLLLWLAMTAGALVFSFAGDTSQVAGELQKGRTTVQLRGVASPFVQAVTDHPPALASPSTGRGTILPSW